MTMRLFAQINKVDAAQRLVYGRACQEVVDRSGEIFDYESSKPYFKAWSDGIAKDTDGKSLGNIRAMHGKISAGKVTAIDFNDTDKAVDICSKIVDDNEWNKVQEGCYTGFSIGGSYVGEKKTEKMADGGDVKRYTANPNEISLVDQPCVPTAKFFDIVKADGSVEKVAFKPAPIEVNGTDEQVAEFAAALNEKSMTMADAIALVKAKDVKPPEPHALVKAALDLVSVVGEIAAATELAKADATKAPAADLLAKRADHSQKIHDMLGEMGAKCAKSEPTGDLVKAADDIAKLTKRLDDADAEIKKLKDQPVPFVTLRAVARAEADKAPPDVSKITIGDLKPDELIKNADGTPDYTTSLLNKREKMLIAHAASNS